MTEELHVDEFAVSHLHRLEAHFSGGDGEVRIGGEFDVGLRCVLGLALLPGFLGCLRVSGDEQVLRLWRYEVGWTPWMATNGLRKAAVDGDVATAATPKAPMQVDGKRPRWWFGGASR